MMQHNAPKNFADDQDSIIACCTPQGSGAVALLRLCGTDALELASRIAKLSSGTSLADVATHTIHHGHVVDHESAEIIDEVLFFVMQAPKTFTGQNTVEITCHNNPFIIERIIALACASGARHAQAGEFTKRAFLNKKIDLVQAESINDLIHAQSELALRKSMAQLKGTLSQFLATVEQQLITLTGSVEASFEFLDEEQRDFSFDAMIMQQLEQLRQNVASALAGYSQQEKIKDGIRIVLAGAVNAGKSTLFNALLKRDRAIVTAIAGTTRDTIEASVYKNGSFRLLVDTAGFRQTDDIIEQQGIERSREQMALADIVIFVVDGSLPLSSQQMLDYAKLINEHAAKTIVVINKSDAQQAEIMNQIASCAPGHDTISLSAREKKGIENLELSIEKRMQEIFKTLQSPYLLNKRQYAVLADLADKLDFIVKQNTTSVHYEIVACHLKELLEQVSELTGKNITEQVLDTIFSSFCIGK